MKADSFLPVGPLYGGASKPGRVWGFLGVGGGLDDNFWLFIAAFNPQVIFRIW